MPAMSTEGQAGAFPALAERHVHLGLRCRSEASAGVRCGDRDLVVQRLPDCCTSQNTRAKFYFVQDNEPQFYPAGSASALVEETYRFGLPGIVNTPGLAEVYASYGNPAVSFVPAVDRDRYHPPTEPRDPDAPGPHLLLRPSSSSPATRSAWASRRWRKLKRRLGDRVEIICAGEDWNPGQFGFGGQIQNLGVLGSLDEVAALYRTCDIGLVFMQTKHPSYQPFEFMASGMATVSNLNPPTELAAARRRELPADAAAADADGRAPVPPGRRPRAAAAHRRRRISRRSVATAGRTRSRRSGT